MQSAPLPSSFSSLLAAAIFEDGASDKEKLATKKDLATKIGVDETYLTHILAGRRTPEARVLYLIGEALDWTRAQKAHALDLVGAEKQASKERHDSPGEV